MSGRKKKIYLSLEEKIGVVKGLQNGETVASLSKEYFVSKSKIYTIRRNQKALLKMSEDYENGNFGAYSVMLNERKPKENIERERKWKSRKNSKIKTKHVGENPLPQFIAEDEVISTTSLDSETLLQENILPVKEECSSDEAIMLVSNPPPLTEEHLESQEKATLILSNDPLVKMEELMSLEESSENVVCSTYEKFQEILSNFETDTYTKYIITKTKGAFAEDDVPFMQRRVRWWDSGSLSGVPYIIVSTRYFSCRYGAPTHSKVLEKYAKKREEQHKLGLCKRYKKVQGSKKLGCPVKFVAHRLLIFPDFQIPSDAPCFREEREEIKQNLKRNFKSFSYESRYTCVLPDIETHQFHYLGPSSASKEPMDRRVLQRIKMLVNVGKTDPDDITEFMEDFARVELNVQDKDRRRFYPSRIDIMHTINRAKLKIRIDQNEQETIKSMQQSWGSSNEVFLRPMKLTKDDYLEKEDPESSSRFLFVYQNREMKKLFSLYGRNSVFLDAIHRTCEYAWPFYFLIVNTNVNYQVVGFFIIQHESKGMIGEALELIKSWNPGVNPKYAVVNRPWEEMKALEAVYPEVKAFVSTYHRNQAWEKKLLRRENDGLNRSEILSKLCNVANATNEKELRSAIAQLKESDAYKASSVKSYYESSWHLQFKRWVAAYKQQDFYFEMNNGVQRLEGDVKYDYLLQLKSKPLSVIINTLIKKYIPSNLVSYKKENLRMFHKYRNYRGIPTYLCECSEWILDQVLIAHLEAMEESDQYLVQYVSERVFMISYAGNNNNNTFYEVNFQPCAKSASCNCSLFKKTKVICKHVIIVGIKFSEWHLSRISCWLFDNPICKLDTKFDRRQDSASEHTYDDDDDLDTSLEAKGDFDKANSTTVESENTFSLHDHLQTKCKSELRALESLSILLNEDRLQTLLSKLKSIREENSQYLNSIEEYLNGSALKGEITEHFVEHDSNELEEMVIEIDKIS